MRSAALTLAHSSHHVKDLNLLCGRHGNTPNHLFLMLSGFRITEGTEDFQPPLIGVSVLSSLISVVFKAGTRVLRILWQSGEAFLSSLAHEFWISPVFCGAFRAGEKVWSLSGWDLLVGEVISERLTFRLLLPGESNGAPESCWEILVLGVLGKPNPKRNHHRQCMNFIMSTINTLNLVLAKFTHWSYTKTWVVHIFNYSLLSSPGQVALIICLS